MDCWNINCFFSYVSVTLVNIYRRATYTASLYILDVGMPSDCARNSAGNVTEVDS